jgi:hypothetical protein
MAISLKRAMQKIHNQKSKVYLRESQKDKPVPYQGEIAMLKPQEGRNTMAESR